VKAKNLVQKYYELHLKIYQMYTNMNDYELEFNQLSDLKNHISSILSPMQPKIKVIEHDLTEIGKRIIESNITADQCNAFNELTKER